MKLDALDLPKDLIWADEFDWQPMTQTERYSMAGNFFIETATKQKGQSITLQGGKDYGLTTRATVKALQQKLTPNTLVLTLNDNRIFDVVFDFNSTPISAKPLHDYVVHQDSDLYTLTLKFLTV